MTKFTIKDWEIVKTEYGIIEVFADTQPDDMVVYVNGRIEVITNPEEYSNILRTKLLDRLRIEEENRVNSISLFENIQKETLLTLDTTSEAAVTTPVASTVDTTATLSKITATTTTVSTTTSKKKAKV